MAQFNIQPTMVFPSTKMDSVNKLITEGNLTRLINKLIDTDSYIIPPDSANMSKYTNTDFGTMIEVETPKLDNIEFLLHGYYFNMGNIDTLVTIASNLATSDKNNITGNFVISACINIQTDATNGGKYPELFGQNLIKQTLLESFPTDPTLEESFLPKIPDELSDKPITKIMFSHKNPAGEMFDDGLGSYDANGVILKPEGLEFESGCEYFYSIEYKDYSSLITLYVTNPGDKLSESQVVLNVDNATEYVTPDDLQSYTIDLLYVDVETSKIYIPMNKFAKFNHQSIASIDGGEF